MTRVAAYIDGFNLYHAINDLGESHLKWVDLWKLCRTFAPGPANSLEAVYYFSAFANWRPESAKRHREFVRAQEVVRVTPVMSNFKAKEKGCRRCGATWIDHEEKETDVAIATYLILGAVRDEYDRALLVSADSDLAPAIKAVRALAPSKEIVVLTPPGREPNLRLAKLTGGRARGRKIKRAHLEQALLPAEVRWEDGTLHCVRPSEYDPP